MEQGNLIDVGKASGPYTVTFRLQTFTVKEADPARWKAGPAVRSAEGAFHLAKAIYARFAGGHGRAGRLMLDLPGADD